jgi:hypothetical protein
MRYLLLAGVLWGALIYGLKWWAEKGILHGVTQETLLLFFGWMLMGLIVVQAVFV